MESYTLLMPFKAVCTIHGKSRTLANLEDDGAGGMKCTESAQCQTGGGGGGGGDMMSLSRDPPQCASLCLRHIGYSPHRLHLNRCVWNSGT